jgi:hypothetical protein
MAPLDAYRVDISVASVTVRGLRNYDRQTWVDPLQLQN